MTTQAGVRLRAALAGLLGAVLASAAIGLAVAQGAPGQQPPVAVSPGQPVSGDPLPADDLDALFEQLNAQTPEDAEAADPEAAALPAPEWGQQGLLADPLAGEADVIVEPKPGVMIPREAFQSQSGAVLRGLDKITGRFTDLPVRVGTPITFGSLEITLQACYDTPPDVLPESAAFLKIRSQKAMAPESLPEAVAQRLEGVSEDSEERKRPQVFSGWMFGSSPGLNALEHPVYDIWVISCSAS